MKNKFLCMVLILSAFSSAKSYGETTQQIAAYGELFSYWRVMRTVDQGEVRQYFVYGCSDVSQQVTCLSVYRTEHEADVQSLLYDFDVQEGDWRILRSRVVEDGKRLALVFKFDDGIQFSFENLFFAKLRYISIGVGPAKSQFFQMLKLSRNVTVDILLQDSTGASKLYDTYHFNLTGTSAALNRMMSEPF